MGRNARRRKGVRQTLADLSGQGLDLGHVAHVVAADGYQGLVVTGVDTDPEAQGFEIVCSECGRRGHLPSKPDPFPDSVSCPDCMRARIARGLDEMNQMTETVGPFPALCGQCDHTITSAEDMWSHFHLEHPDLYDMMNSIRRARE